MNKLKNSIITGATVAWALLGLGAWAAEPTAQPPAGEQPAPAGEQPASAGADGDDDARDERSARRPTQIRSVSTPDRSARSM